jgi:hypothetical protein
MLPMRREDDVLVQELPEETLVYDLKRNKAHCLNRTAALVWHHCDGQTSVHDMAELLRQELRISADEQIVWLTLARLQRAHLLLETISPPGELPRLSRRDWVRKLGVAAVLVPAVLTTIARSSASAASCRSISCSNRGNCVSQGCSDCGSNGKCIP